MKYTYVLVPLLIPLAAYGFIKLAAWISSLIPEGRLKRLLLHELWRDDAPGRRQDMRGVVRKRP